MAPGSTAWIEIGDARLWSARAGSGSAVVLVHGFALDHRMWEGVVPRLAADHTVIAYDVRGFGRSSLPAAPYAHYDDLRAVLDHHGIDRAHLVGHSIGGHQVLEAALAWPDRVDSACVIGLSGLGSVPFTDDIAAMFADVRQAARTVGVAAAKARWAAGGWTAPALRHPEVAPAVDAILRDYSGHHWIADNPFRRLVPPPAERLDALAVPLTVVVGDADLPYNQEIAQVLARDVAGARYVVAPGSHMLPMEDPAATAGILRDHLAWAEGP